MLVAWCLPRRPRKAWLLVTSLVFYASWHVKYVVLLASVGAIASVGGALVDRASGPSRRLRGTIVVALLAAVLGAFKYLDWAFEHLNFVVARLGGGPFLAPHWLLPLGVSFYTFEAIGYIVEVTRNKERRYGFFDFQLFLSFYPHLVAGPIMRAKELIPQFEAEEWRPRREQILSGLQTLAIGLFLKNVIVDKFSWEVDAAFAQPLTEVGWKDALSMAVGFAVQIYLDFSAYSRLAIGSAQLFGIELTENFNYPFRARNPADFWNRWHISLSRWIRDYLFFPLVGKRMRVSRMCWASIASMVLCGLWHGAGYTFILWGAYHGLLTAGYYVARWALGQWRTPLRRAHVGPAPPYLDSLSRREREGGTATDRYPADALEPSPPRRRVREEAIRADGRDLARAVRGRGARRSFVQPRSHAAGSLRTGAWRHRRSRVALRDSLHGLPDRLRLLPVLSFRRAQAAVEGTKADRVDPREVVSFVRVLAEVVELAVAQTAMDDQLVLVANEPHLLVVVGVRTEPRRPGAVELAAECEGEQVRPHLLGARR